MIYLTLTKYGYFCAIGERVQTVTQIYRQRRVQQFYWNVDGVARTMHAFYECMMTAKRIVVLLT